MKSMITWAILKGKKATVSISTENKKLQPTALVKFLIWSIPALLTCPFATALCKMFCYARKAERNYPDALPSRERNFRFSQTDAFVSFMIRAIHYICGLKAYKNAKRIVFRIHESGDFYNQRYADKWIAICNGCADIHNLLFMAYTKSAVYFEEYRKSGTLPKNLRLRGSIWADTDPKQAELLRQYPIYSACSQEEWDALPEENKCHCEDCANCGKCWESTVDIWCVIH